MLKLLLILGLFTGNLSAISNISNKLTFVWENRKYSDAQILEAVNNLNNSPSVNKKKEAIEFLLKSLIFLAKNDFQDIHEDKFLSIVRHILNNEPSEEQNNNLFKTLIDKIDRDPVHAISYNIAEIILENQFSDDQKILLLKALIKKIENNIINQHTYNLATIVLTNNVSPQQKKVFIATLINKMNSLRDKYYIADLATLILTITESSKEQKGSVIDLVLEKMNHNDINYNFAEIILNNIFSDIQKKEVLDVLVQNLQNDDNSVNIPISKLILQHHPSDEQRYTVLDTLEHELSNRNTNNYSDPYGIETAKLILENNPSKKQRFKALEKLVDELFNVNNNDNKNFYHTQIASLLFTNQTSEEQNKYIVDLFVTKLQKSNDFLDPAKVVLDSIKNPKQKIPILLSLDEKLFLINITAQKTVMTLGPIFKHGNQTLKNEMLEEILIKISATPNYKYAEYLCNSLLYIFDINDDFIPDHVLDFMQQAHRALLARPDATEARVGADNDVHNVMRGIMPLFVKKITELTQGKPLLNQDEAIDFIKNKINEIFTNEAVGKDSCIKLLNNVLLNQNTDYARLLALFPTIVYLLNTDNVWQEGLGDIQDRWTNWLDTALFESANAYGPDSPSCPRGVLERSITIFQTLKDGEEIFSSEANINNFKDQLPKIVAAFDQEYGPEADAIITSNMVDFVRNRVSCYKTRLMKQHFLERWLRMMAKSNPFLLTNGDLPELKEHLIYAAREIWEYLTPKGSPEIAEQEQEADFRSTEDSRRTYIKQQQGTLIPEMTNLSGHIGKKSFYPQLQEFYELQERQALEDEEMIDRTEIYNQFNQKPFLNTEAFGEEFLDE